jgi:heavy metal sensor kinase
VFNSIRARIALYTGALSLVVVICLGLFLYSSLRAQLYQSTDNTLRIRADQLLDSIDFRDEQIQFDPEDIPPVSLRDDEAAHLISPSGVVLDSIGDEFAPQAATSENEASRFLTIRFWEGDPEDKSEYEMVRLLITPVIQDGDLVAYLQVGHDLSYVQEAVGRLLQLLLLAGPVMVGIAAAGGYWLTGQALAPIEKVRGQAASIQAEGLSQRLDLAKTNDEVERLTLTFNEMLDRLEQSFLRQRRFTADASHELRTPLAIIRGEIDVALERPRSFVEYVETLQSVGAEADRMTRLVNELLLLARSDSGELRLEMLPFDLADLLRLMVEQIQPKAREMGTRIHADLPPSLPIVGDKDRLMELFLNIIENALLHAPGSLIEVQAQPDGEQIVVTIADTGPGITAEHLPHIFDRFYRVDPVREHSYRGSGLGLAIAQEIAQAHQGRITVESTPGKGTTFTVHLRREPSGPKESIQHPAIRA